MSVDQRLSRSSLPAERGRVSGLGAIVTSRRGGVFEELLGEALARASACTSRLCAIACAMLAGSKRAPAAGPAAPRAGGSPLGAMGRSKGIGE